MRNFVPNVTGTALLAGKKMWVFVKSWTFSLKRKCVTVEKMTKKSSEETHEKLIQQYFIFRDKL